MKLPQVKPREAIAALKRAGFVVDHTRGSHYYLVHPTRPDDFVTVAYHTKPLKKGTLHAIIKQAGMTVEEFVKLL